MPVVARTRFLVGRLWCVASWYESRYRGEVVARFAVGLIEGDREEWTSTDRLIDCIRRLRAEAERRQGIEAAGRSNTGRCAMGGKTTPVQGAQ